MTECPYPEIMDSLPDLLHGRLGEVDRATLTAHVEFCAACRAELALLRQIRASAPLAPAIDVARIAAVLPVRSVVVPELPQRPSASGIHSPIWKFAAAIAIVISGGLLVQDRGGVADIAGRPGAAVATPTLAESESADVGVPSVPAEDQPASLSLVAGVQELTDEEIENLLVELDAIEVIPSEEPELGMIYLEVE